MVSGGAADAVAGGAADAGAVGSLSYDDVRAVPSTSSSSVLKLPLNKPGDCELHGQSPDLFLLTHRRQQWKLGIPQERCWTLRRQAGNYKKWRDR